MSNVPTLQPNGFLAAINTCLGASYTCLPDAWLIYLQTQLSSSSLDVQDLEWTWLDGFTSLGTGATEDQWYKYLTDQGYTGAIPDLVNQAIVQGTILGLGPELVIGDNFTFDSVGDWVGEDCSLAVAGNVLTATYTAGTQRIQLPYTTELGLTYRISGSIRSATNTSQVQFGTAADLAPVGNLTTSFQKYTRDVVGLGALERFQFFTLLGVGQTADIEAGFSARVVLCPIPAVTFDSDTVTFDGDTVTFG